MNIFIKMVEGFLVDYLKCCVIDLEMELLYNEFFYDLIINLYYVWFVLLRFGCYRVDVEYDGVLVEGFLFMLNIEGSEGYKKVFVLGDGFKGGKCLGWRGWGGVIF